MEAQNNNLTANDGHSSRESAIQESGEYKHMADSSTEDDYRNYSAVKGSITYENSGIFILAIEEPKNDSFNSTGRRESSSVEVADTLKQEKRKLSCDIEDDNPNWSIIECCLLFTYYPLLPVFNCSIFEIVSALVYLHSCNIEPHVYEYLIFLIIDGSVSLVYAFPACLYVHCCNKDNKHRQRMFCSALIKAGLGLAILSYVFYIAWLIFTTLFAIAHVVR